MNQAFNWGSKHGIKILVDIHAAKGSQNGNEHSAPNVYNERYWFKFDENRKFTLDLVNHIMNQYKNKSAFLGIGLLNEPWVLDSSELALLKTFYEEAIRLIRSTHKSKCIITYSESVNG